MLPFNKISVKSTSFSKFWLWRRPEALVRCSPENLSWRLWFPPMLPSLQTCHSNPFLSISVDWSKSTPGQCRQHLCRIRGSIKDDKKVKFKKGVKETRSWEAQRSRRKGPPYVRMSEKIETFVLTWKFTGPLKRNAIIWAFLLVHGTSMASRRTGIKSPDSINIFYSFSSFASCPFFKEFSLLM